MLESVIAGLSGLASGSTYLFTQGLPNVVMLAIAGALLEARRAPRPLNAVRILHGQARVGQGRRRDGPSGARGIQQSEREAPAVLIAQHGCSSQKKA